MGTIPKITKVQLKVNQNYKPALLGIVSAEPDYKLSLAINKNLKISLRNTSPVVIPDEAPEKSFSRFSDTKTLHGSVFELITNRYGKNILLRKLKNIDYLFQIHDPDNETNTEIISASLRSIDHVTAVFTLDPGSIRDKNLQYLIR